MAATSTPAGPPPPRGPGGLGRLRGWIRTKPGQAVAGAGAVAVAGYALYKRRQAAATGATVPAAAQSTVVPYDPNATTTAGGVPYDTGAGTDSSGAIQAAIAGLGAQLGQLTAAQQAGLAPVQASLDQLTSQLSTPTAPVARAPVVATPAPRPEPMLSPLDTAYKAYTSFGPTTAANQGAKHTAGEQLQLQQQLAILTSSTASSAARSAAQTRANQLQAQLRTGK